MATIDQTFANLRTFFGAFRYFRHGWGRPQSIHASWLQRVRTRSFDPSTKPKLSINRVWHIPTASLVTFDSPCADFLPASSKKARALYLQPSSPTSALAILLPATGDHGFTRRLLTHGLALRRAGVACVLLQSPFYGARRPSGQFGALLRFVHELPDLGRATIEEAGVLARYFYEAGFRKIVASGISQGGLHAVMTASILPFPVHTVAALAPHSAVPVFTEGVLGGLVHWEGLGENAKERLRQVLSISDIRNFPEGVGGEQVFIFALNDRYVSPECVDIWEEARPGASVRWVQGGHVTASAFRFPVITNAILEVLSPEGKSIL